MAIQDSLALTLGDTLTTAFSKGIRDNISKNYKEFEYVQSIKAESDVSGAPRDIKYLVLKSYGPSSVQFRDPNASSYAFPAGQQSSQTEAKVVFKEMVSTVPFNQSLWERLLASKDKYVADRLANEVKYKEVSAKRQICIDFYGDGSGALGQVASAALVAGQAVVTLANTSSSRGFAGNFQYDEQVINYTTAGVAGVAPTLASGTIGWFQVVARDAKPSTNTVTLQAYDTTGVARAISAWVPAAGELLYKYDPVLSTTLAYPDLTSVSDWATVSAHLPGLASLVANDGRVVNNLTMSGALASSVFDCGGNQIDIQYIEEAMNEVKNNTGDEWKFDKLLMNRFTKSSLIEARNTDRRFTVAADNQMSVGSLKQAHEEDMMKFAVTEFCPFNAIYAIPSNALEGKKALSMYGTDFKAARTPDGNSVWHLLPGSAAYTNLMHMYFRGNLAMVANHPAAMVRISNFTI